MCGIAGTIRYDGHAVDEGKLAAVIEAADHRGPDDGGMVLDGPVGLAHRRLSIIDLDPRGRQPMAYRDRYHITYNGEIYNYLELRAELEALGHQFVTTTDTEVILAAYDQWGKECLQRFNGMWAFAIYDRRTQEVFLSRDRFGVKPLYHMRLDGAFWFASEIKQLLTVKADRRANLARVLDYLVTTYENHTDETFFDGIRSLHPGTYMRLDRGGRVLEQKAFYELGQRGEFASMKLEDAVSRVSALLEDAVRLRLRSDVKVGTCLSGGLDSSIISAIASEQFHRVSRERFIGIHAKSVERATDESEYARRVADGAGIDLFPVEPTSADFVETIDEVVFTQEEPFGSPSMFMGWHVFREAKRLGCRVMLNGQGGDEIFLGYERYFPLELSAADPVGFLRKIWQQARNSKLSIREALQYYAYFKFDALRIARLRANKYLRSRYLADYAFDAVTASAGSYVSAYALQKLEIETLQLPHLLRYEDRNSMRHSVETRLPFLDYRLVEAAVSLPLSYKIRDGWTKYIVRRVAEPRLAREVTWRKIKLGFEAPNRTWFSDYAHGMKSEMERSGFLREIVDVAAVVRDFEKLPMRVKWNCFNLAAWARIYGVTL